MSATIYLEIELGMPLEDVIKLLEAIPTAVKLGDLRFYIENSKIEVFVSTPKNNHPKDVIAEGLEKAKWKVGTIIHFRLGPEGSDVELKDIGLVVNKIITQTKFQFVLSFEFEKIYACRDFIIGNIELNSEISS
ncbi:MAG TPA: hypothetical protein VIZ65_08695 [Cellvibrionaceae bacterium]